MFGFFSKKDKGLKVHDRVWLTDAAKFKGCVDLKKVNPNVVFIAWFEDTKSSLQGYFQQNNMEEPVYLADRLGLAQQSSELIFVEHHPLRAEEQRLADELGKNELTFFSALTEPIFQLFGGDKMIALMRKMGMDENEMIEHNMVSTSIKNAQEKMASRSVINVSARSQADWLQNAGLNTQTIK